MLLKCVCNHSVSVYLHINLSVYLSVHLSIDLSPCLSIYLIIYYLFVSVWWYVYSLSIFFLSIYLLMHRYYFLHICVSVCLSICHCFHLYMYVCLSIYLRIRLSVCMHVHIHTENFLKVINYRYLLLFWVLYNLSLSPLSSSHILPVFYTLIVLWVKAYLHPLSLINTLFSPAISTLVILMHSQIHQDTV